MNTAPNCHPCSIKDGSWEQCSLQKNQFSETELENCVFVSTQLRSTQLENCTLRGGSLRGCAAPRISMKRVRMKGLSMAEPEINHAIIKGLSALNCILSAEHPSGLTGIRNSTVTTSLFINCRIRGPFFAFSRLENSLFLDCRFSDTDWDLTERANTSFINCQNGPSQSLSYKGNPHKEWTQWEWETGV